MKKLLVISSTRADWGLLSPISKALSSTGDISVRIVATNMHLSEKYGMTFSEIEKDGFEIIPVPTITKDEMSPKDCADLMSRTMEGMGVVFEEERPDAILLLGDRYEILATACVAAVMNIPLIHISGGEITEGANDNAFRHAITKLSSLHLTAAEEYRHRVIQMGEQPSSVINTGAIGVWNSKNIKKLSRSELSAELGFSLEGGPVAVVTYHPVTYDAQASDDGLKNLLAVLDDHPEMRIVVTFPNNDAHSEPIIQAIEDFSARHSNVLAVRSLGHMKYLSLLALADVCIGNSSSGIVEAPSFGVPTVNIGFRQKGRLAAESVIHTSEEKEDISQALDKALSEDFRTLARNCSNPYGMDDTLNIMVKAVSTFMQRLPAEPKKFYDIEL